MQREHCKPSAGVRRPGPGAGRFLQPGMPPASVRTGTSRPAGGVPLRQEQFWEHGMQGETGYFPLLYIKESEVWLVKAFLHKLRITPTCSPLLDFVTAYIYCYTSRSKETTTWCTDLKPSWLIKTQERSSLIIKGSDPCFSSGRDFPTFPENAGIYQEVKPHTFRLFVCGPLLLWKTSGMTLPTCSICWYHWYFIALDTSSWQWMAATLRSSLIASSLRMLGREILKILFKKKL